MPIKIVKERQVILFVNVACFLIFPILVFPIDFYRFSAV